MTTKTQDLYEGNDPQALARTYPYKYYDPSRQSLSTARANFSGLHLRELDDLSRCKPREMSTSKFSAEHEKQTIFNEGIYKTEPCKYHPKLDNGDRLKTGLGWLPRCCAEQLDLPRLPCEPLKPFKNEDEVLAEYVDRRYELVLIIGLRQHEATQRSLATRAARKAEKDRLESNAKKVVARAAKKKVEKALKATLETPLEPHPRTV